MDGFLLSSGLPQSHMASPPKIYGRVGATAWSSRWLFRVWITSPGPTVGSEGNEQLWGREIPSPKLSRRILPISVLFVLHSQNPLQSKLALGDGYHSSLYVLPWQFPLSR